MSAARTISIGAGIMATLMVGVILLQFGSEVRVSVENTRTQLFYNESGEFKLLAREYSELYNGSRKLSPQLVRISTHETDHSMNIIREYHYANGALLRDHYFFSGDVDDIQLFPLSHTVELFNAAGLQYRYRATDVKGIPFTTYTDRHVLQFGRVKFFIDDRAQSIKTTKSGTVTVKWHARESYERFSIRMVDPDPADTVVWGCDFNNGSVCGIIGLGAGAQQNISGDGIVNATSTYQTWTIPYNHSTLSYFRVVFDAYMNTTQNMKVRTNENISTTANQHWLIDVNSGQQRFRPEPGYSPAVQLSYGRHIFNFSTNKTSLNYMLNTSNGTMSYVNSTDFPGSYIRIETGQNNSPVVNYLYFSNITIFALASESGGGPDTTKPIISAVSTSAITNQSAVVSWTTDESANESVNYGTTTALSTGSNNTNTLGTSHSRTLSGLSASTLYYFNVTSCDASANCNTTGPYNFTTTNGSGSSSLIQCYTFAGSDGGWTGYTASDLIAGWIGHETPSASLINSPDLGLTDLRHYRSDIILKPKRTHNSKYYLNTRQYNTDDAHLYFEDNNASGSGAATHVLKFYSAGSGYSTVLNGIPHDTEVTIVSEVDLDSLVANGSVSVAGNATVTSWGPYTITENGDYVTYLEGQNESAYNKIENFCYYSVGAVGAPAATATLNLTNVYPGHANVSQFAFFNYTTMVRCEGNSSTTCGNVTAYLDPIPGVAPSTTGFGGKSLATNYEDYINGFTRYGQVKLVNLTGGVTVATVPWFGTSPYWGDYCHAGNLKTSCGAAGTFNDYCQVTDEASQAYLALSMTRNASVANIYFRPIVDMIRVMNATNTTHAVCGSAGCNWGHNTKWRWRVTCSGTPQTCSLIPTQDTAPDADARNIIALFNIYNNPVYTDTATKTIAYNHVQKMCADFKDYSFVSAQGKSRVDGSFIINRWPAVSASITKNGAPARGYDSYAFPGYWGDFALAMTACGMNNQNATNQSIYFAYANDSIEAFLSAADWTSASNAPRQPDGRQGKWSNITTGTSADTPQYVCQQACVGGNEDADSIRWPKLCAAHGFAAQNGVTINPHVAEYCGDYVNASAHQSTSCPIQWSTSGGALSSVGLGYKQNGLCAYGDFSSEQGNWLTRMVATGTAKWSTSNLWYNDNTGQSGGTPCFGIYWGEFIVSAHGYGIGYADSTFNLSLGSGGSNATAVCGNGNIESGEQCDDGNTLSGDGCSATCQTEVGAKGLVSTVVGATPFYTNRSNPQTGANTSCLYNMVGNTSCNVTWYVNATGTAGTSWDFFAYATSTVNATVVRESSTQNVSIRDARAPAITNVSNRSITASSAVISWNTNEVANATVSYNTSSTVLRNITGSATLALWRQIMLSGLVSNTTYFYNVTSCDNSSLGAKNCNTTGPYNFTTLSSASNVTMNITLSPNIELGTLISISANNSPGTSICIDIDHPDYGTNYACGSGSVTVNITPTYFRKTTFNDSTTVKNITFAGPGNQTVYVRLHVLDELRSLLLNVTGFSSGGIYPNGVELYAGRNLSNTIGLLLNSSKGSVTTFSDASTEKNVTFTTASTQVAGYLYLPKQADVTSATFSFRGTDDFTRQENANSTSFGIRESDSFASIYMNYSKPPTVSNNSLWMTKMGNSSSGTVKTENNTLPLGCWNQGTTLQLRLRTSRTSTTHSSEAQCYNGSSWQNVTVSGLGTATTFICNYRVNPSYSEKVFDGDYNTYGFWSWPDDDYVGEGWCDFLYPGKGSTEYTAERLYEETMYWSLAPTNPFMEVGYITGVRDWSHPGHFNTTSVSGNVSAKINTFLESCTANSQGYCLVPVYVYSEGGRLSVNNVSVDFTYEVNPVNVSLSGLSQYLSSNNTTGFVDVPLTFYSAQEGIIQINDVKLDYVGGNSTINVTAHNDAYTSVRNVSLILHHSRWNYSFPQNVRSFEFVPQTPSSKQVQPRGQSSSKPFLNITSLAYSQPFNFSVYVNESYSCVNLTWWNASNYSQSIQANGTWKDLLRLSLGNSSGVWVWADYACNYTTWRAWRPQVSLRACAVGSYCDEGR